MWVFFFCDKSRKLLYISLYNTQFWGKKRNQCDTVWDLFMVLLEMKVIVGVRIVKGDCKVSFTISFFALFTISRRSHIEILKTSS